MEVEVDAKTIFPCILQTTKKVTPGYLWYIWIGVVGGYRPVGIRQTNVVKSSGLDICERLLVDEGRIVFLYDCFCFRWT